MRGCAGGRCRYFLASGGAGLKTRTRSRKPPGFCPGGLTLLLAPVTAIEGIGASGAALLSRLLKRTYNPIEDSAEEIVPRVRDLLFHLPVDVTLRQLCPALAQVETPKRATVIVTVIEHVSGAAGPQRGRRQPYRVVCGDPSGELTLLFFHGSAEHLRRLFAIGARLVVSGRAERYQGALQMAHPDIVRPAEVLAEVLSPEPVYPLTADLAMSRLIRWIASTRAMLGDMPEWLDRVALERYGWPAWTEAIAFLHTPRSRDDLNADTPARQRLAYDEALASQIALMLVRRFEGRHAGPRFAMDGPLTTRQLSRLPFRLTGGQQQVMKEIAADLTSGHAMLRLLQGDVGSGKTVIAFLAMLSAIDGGTQAAIMAPTAILAQQHFRLFRLWAEALGIRAEFLAGSVKEPERSALLRRIASGETQMVIGTHALFQKSVRFRRLGLAVIDEQHRFGVMQRMALATKNEGEATHLLLMTATPIPRSLTLTLYGDLDSSLLKEKPAGRQKITTRAVPLSREDEILGRLPGALEEGARIYWICPLVGDDDSPAESEFQAALVRHQHLSGLFPGRVGLVHGRMKAEDREAEMQAFAEGRTSILVATTVIEVGVDVPEASVIVIENAERFGLSQLHQLRGRVGRGERSSSCVLLYGEPLGATAKQRLQAIRDHDDGFLIAEEDLRLRGGGDLLGTRQSGLPEFRFVDLARHAGLIAEARKDAEYYLARDPQLKEPRGKALVGLLHLFGYDRTVELVRSG